MNMKNAVFKKFSSKEEAETFIHEKTSNIIDKRKKDDETERPKYLNPIEIPSSTGKLFFYLTFYFLEFL